MATPQALSSPASPGAGLTPLQRYRVQQACSLTVAHDSGREALARHLGFANNERLFERAMSEAMTTVDQLLAVIDQATGGCNFLASEDGGK